MKPFKGILHREDSRVPAYGERFSGYVKGWNDIHISITTSKVIAIQPVRQDICLIETMNSIYLVDLTAEELNFNDYFPE